MSTGGFLSIILCPQALTFRGADVSNRHGHMHPSSPSSALVNSPPVIDCPPSQESDTTIPDFLFSQFSEAETSITGLARASGETTSTRSAHSQVVEGAPQRQEDPIVSTSLSSAKRKYRRPILQRLNRVFDPILYQVDTHRRRDIFLPPEGTSLNHLH